MHETVERRGALRQVQKHCYRKLRHRFGAVGGHVANRDSPLTRGIQINVIIPRRQLADELQLTCVHQHGIRAAQPLRNHGRVRAIVNGKRSELFQRRPIEISRIDAVSIQNDNLHIEYPFIGL